MTMNIHSTTNSGQMLYDLMKSTRRIVMLDYDGTLAPFVVDRDKAYAYSGVYEALDKIMARADTRLVIVTGRSLADILPLLQLQNLPEIYASHGWERRSASGEITSIDSKLHTSAFEAALRVAREHGLEDKIEQKSISVAIHWRGELQEKKSNIITYVRPEWNQIALQNNLDLHSFDGGFELRIPGKNKGTAITEILNNEPSDAFVIYLGDDMTDEDAFAVVRDRGYGILIGQEYRRTKAQLWTQPPQGLINILEMLS